MAQMLFLPLARAGAWTGSIADDRARSPSSAAPVSTTAPRPPSTSHRLNRPGPLRVPMVCSDPIPPDLPLVAAPPLGALSTAANPVVCTFAARANNLADKYHCVNYVAPSRRMPCHPGQGPRQPRGVT
jgi:hypothetical protein